MFSSVFVIHKNCFAIKYPPFVVTDYYYIVIPHKYKNRNPFVSELRFMFGGEGEIRTLEPLLTVTRFPVVRPRPTRRLLQIFDWSVFRRLAYYITSLALCQYLFSYFLFFRKKKGTATVRLRRTVAALLDF